MSTRFGRNYQPDLEKTKKVEKDKIKKRNTTDTHQP